MSRRGPLPQDAAWAAVARCLVSSVGLLGRGRIRGSDGHLGRRIRFADGSSARVYRETLRQDARPADPCVLLVAFRLRAVRGRGHDAFERESLLHVPLFVGFPGFVSKLWLAHDQHGVYRGLYEWDGADRAEDYARALWRVLALVSVPGSIDYRVLPRRRRDDVLAAPGGPGPAARPATGGSGDPDDWWRVVEAA